MAGPKSIVLDAVTALPAVSRLPLADVAKLVVEVDTLLATTAELRHVERVVLPLCTHVFSARARALEA